MATRQEWNNWFDLAKSHDILRVAQDLGARLKKAATAEFVGACLIDGGTDRFSVNTRKQVFNCRGVEEGGDIIKMVCHCLGCSIPEACERITGRSRPDSSRDESMEDRAARIHENSSRMEAARIRQEKEHEVERIKARRDEEAVSAIIDRAVPIEGTHAEAYLKIGRGLTPNKRLTADLRFVAALDYWEVPGNGSGELRMLASLPALIAVIRNFAGDVIGISQTYLDPKEPTKWRPTGSVRNSAKKIRGQKKGGMIRLGRPTETLAIGEGWENPLAWDQLRGLGFFGDVLAGEDISLVAAVDLGNLAGKAAGTAPHPTEKEESGRARRIADGRRPDPDGEGVGIPDGVRSVIILGDYDSEVFITASRVALAATRFKMKGLQVSIHFPGWPGLDWNNVLERAVKDELSPLPEPTPPSSSYEQRVANFRHPGAIETYDEYMARVGFLFEPPPTFRFTLIRFASFKPLDADDYCVKGFLPRMGLVVVWGEEKCGKSFFVFDLLMHVALGWDYRGHHVRQGAVVYVTLEGGGGFRKRREAFRQAKLKGDEEPPFYFIVNPLSLAADREDLTKDIRRQLGEDIPAVVCIDTLNRSIAGSENSDEDMGAYIKAADAIRDAFDCLVVVIHHSGHVAQRPRGHSSLMGALDVQIAVRRDAEGYVEARLELAKDGETGLVFLSRLEKVEIGRDTDGDPVTSCVIREVDGTADKVAPRRTKRGRRSDDVEKVKRATIEAYERLADDADSRSGFDGKPVKKIEIERLREEVKSRGFLETENGALTSMARKHFFRAKTDLIESQRYIEDNGMFWKLTSDPSGL
jgi:hypothetical protein